MGKNGSSDFFSEHLSIPLLGKPRSSSSAPSGLAGSVLVCSGLVGSRADLPVAVAGLGTELEELMGEGFLLQVTLPETDQLYRYLFHKLAIPPPPSPAPTNQEAPEQHHHHSRKGSPHRTPVSPPVARLRIPLLV